MFVTAVAKVEKRKFKNFNQIKETVARDFRPSVFFSSINPTYRALFHWLKPFPYGFVFAEIFASKVVKSVSAGPMTPLNPKMKSRIPQLFLVKVKIWYGGYFPMK
jgi:hypothetical protein